MEFAMLQCLLIPSSMTNDYEIQHNNKVSYNWKIMNTLAIKEYLHTSKSRYMKVLLVLGRGDGAGQGQL